MCAKVHSGAGGLTRFDLRRRLSPRRCGVWLKRPTDQGSLRGQGTVRPGHDRGSAHAGRDLVGAGVRRAARYRHPAHRGRPDDRRHPDVHALAEVVREGTLVGRRVRRGRRRGGRRPGASCRQRWRHRESRTRTPTRTSSASSTARSPRSTSTSTPRTRSHCSTPPRPAERLGRGGRAGSKRFEPGPSSSPATRAARH